MPDLIEPPTADAAAQSAFDTFERHTGGKAEPEPKPEEKPDKVETPPVPPVKAEAVKDDSLPDELLGGVKPAAKEEAKPEDEFDKLVNESPTGPVKHENYKRLQAATKARVEKAEAETARLRAEFAAKQPGGVPEETQTELKQLREKLAERDELLERTAYERSPQFQERFGAKETQLREQVRTIGKEYAVEIDTLESILSATGKRRDALVDDLDISEGAKRRLDAHLVNLDTLESDRKAALSKSREELTAYNKDQQAKAEAQEARQRAEEDKVFNEALAEARVKLPAFRKIEGNDAWNAEVAKAEEFARNYFSGGVSIKEMADLALRGMNGPVQDRIIAKLTASVQAKDEQIAKLTAASPGGGGAPAYKPDETNLSAEERQGRTFERHVGALQG